MRQHKPNTGELMRVAMADLDKASKAVLAEADKIREDRHDSANRIMAHVLRTETIIARAAKAKEQSEPQKKLKNGNGVPE